MIDEADRDGTASTLTASQQADLIPASQKVYDETRKISPKSLKRVAKEPRERVTDEELPETIDQKTRSKNLKRVAKELGERKPDEELHEMIDEADRDGEASTRTKRSPIDPGGHPLWTIEECAQRLVQLSLVLPPYESGEDDDSDGYAR